MKRWTVFAQVLEDAKKAGLLHKDVAERVGVTPQMLSYYKTGEGNPTLRMARKLSMVLGKSIDDLFPVEEAQHGEGGSAG